MAFKKLPQRSIQNPKGRVVVVMADFHRDIVDALLEGVEEECGRYQHVELRTVRVPGAFEIPLRAQQLARSGDADVMIALGCVVRGETEHFQLVVNECARGCMQVMLEEGVPVVFEVLAVDDLKQARVRSEGDHNHGRYAAQVALEWISQTSK